MKKYDNIAKRINNSIRLISFHRLVKYLIPKRKHKLVKVARLEISRKTQKFPCPCLCEFNGAESN